MSGSLDLSRVAGSPAAIAETQQDPVHLYQRPDGSSTFDSTRTSLTGTNLEMRFAKVGGKRLRFETAYQRRTPGFDVNDIVLMREANAIEQGKRIYASIGGWGVSSDGKGGITRPEAAGHRLAIKRAYDRAGYGVETVSYFEGHGTGTALGDATEIEALSTARHDADPLAAPAALSTVKGNIGHTKAAAGVAGLIKATLAVLHQVIQQDQT